jgi:hypothetical protein
MVAKQKPLQPGEAKVVQRFRARKKSKLVQRIVRSVPQDCEVWDAACERMGLSFSEFCRRAMNAYAEKR